MAAGALCLGVGLWRSGTLVLPVPAWKKAPPPAAMTVNELLADIKEKTPPPPIPPAPEPFDFPQPAPPVAAPGNQPAPIGPRPPVTHGEADRIAPDLTGLPHLSLPLSGIDPKKLADTFKDARGGRKHEALDIPAPRGTPVLAVAQGNVAKLFTSKEGGLTVYQFDDSRTYCYYYAHLSRYASGLQEGTLLRPGEVLGYVGSTGNASAAAPHLHFAVFKLGPEKKWWVGTAIDPLPMFK
jgi:murein DD-endopeptidase MepM/ murein hydrolase activator NlpD